MTFLEWYGLIAPFILLAFGLVIFAIARFDQIQTVRRIDLLRRQKG